MRESYFKEGMSEKLAEYGVPEEFAEKVSEITVSLYKNPKNASLFSDGFRNTVKAASFRYGDESDWLDKLKYILLATGAAAVGARLGESYGRRQNSVGDSRSIWKSPLVLLDAVRNRVANNIADKADVKLEPSDFNKPDAAASEPSANTNE